jgi:hypothetical protein
MARSNNILIFAAASNNGSNSEISWLARRDDVIYIYAIDNARNPYKFSPSLSQDLISFSILGEAIKLY